MGTRTRRRITAAIGGGLLPLSALLLTPSAVSAEVTPGEATIEIEAGGTATEYKTVTVPELPVKADIVIAIDTTGSMGGAIAEAKAEATQLVNEISADIPDANFAVVDFRDFGDTPEYLVRTPNTDDSALVQAGIDAMSAGGGGDFAEAQNLVFQKAATDDPALWRTDSARFLVLITDAPPHDADINGFLSCPNFSGPDPYGLQTDEVVADLAASQTTLFAVTVNSGIDVGPCYADIAAASFPGSTQAPLGTDLSDQISALIAASSSSVTEVHLEVVQPNANSSWITFDPTTAGPFDTPATVPFRVNINVPAGTPAGTYTFDIVALADGGDVGHQALTIVVPEDNAPPVCTDVKPSRTELWPPNHRFETVTLSGATDPDGDDVAITVTGVTQDEPVNGLGDGDTAPDAQLSDTPGSVDLRAERAGTRDGRVYRISFTADDGQGGTCTGVAKVTVPKSQGKNGAAVESPEVHDSFGA